MQERKPKLSQEQIFFNSLKGQFKTKEAFLRFNEIKKHKAEEVDRALLYPALDKIATMETRISQRNIFEARKGLQACFHQGIGSVFMFGGVGLHPVSCVENFNEDNLEFTKYDRRNVHSLPRFST